VGRVYNRTAEKTTDAGEAAVVADFLRPSPTQTLVQSDLRAVVAISYWLMPPPSMNWKASSTVRAGA
jgi:hypothetical protein